MEEEGGGIEAGWCSARGECCMSLGDSAGKDRDGAVVEKGEGRLCWGPLGVVEDGGWW